MKIFGVLIIIVLMIRSFESNAGVPNNVRYYAGTSVLSVAATGERYPSSRIAVKRTVSQVNSQIVEIACVIDGGGRHRQSPAYMTVSGNRVTIVDNQNMEPGLVEGAGFVSGTPWNWEYLVLDMKTKFGGRTSWIYDTNVVTPKGMYAVKSIYPNIGTNEAPIRGPEPTLLMTIRVKQIAKKQYLREIAALGCDSN